MIHERIFLSLSSNHPLYSSLLPPLSLSSLVSIRELTVSKLYQSFTGTGTCTMTTDDEKMKRKGVDFKDLVHRKVSSLLLSSAALFILILISCQNLLDGLLRNARETIDSRLPRNEKVANK